MLPTLIVPSDTTPAKIDKLSILGWATVSSTWFNYTTWWISTVLSFCADFLVSIRSFDNTRSETIQFHTPLTLIVGYNGSGKTVCSDHPCKQRICWEVVRLLSSVLNMRRQENCPLTARAVPLFMIPRFVWSYPWDPEAHTEIHIVMWRERSFGPGQTLI